MAAALDDLESTYVVLRPFPAMGRTLARGEVVETSEWRNVKPLVGDRRIAHIYSPEGRAALPEGSAVPTLSYDAPEEAPEEAPKRRGRPPKIREDA